VYADTVGLDSAPFFLQCQQYLPSANSGQGLLISHPKELAMQHIIAQAKRFVRDEDGVTAIEYGLIASLIAVAIIVAVTLVGTKLTGVFNTIASDL
jgi:pilus assembly protein Flp/PilA